MAMRPRGGGASSSRVGRTTTVRPVYETFTPLSERLKEEEAEKLLIYLPGFLKENIRVSTEGKTTLKVRGERLIGANKWNRFQEEFQAPDDCNMRGINARFENGILTINMPFIKKTPPPAPHVTTKQEETTTQNPQIVPQLPPQIINDIQKPQIIPQLPPQITTDIQNKPPLPLQPKPPIKSSTSEEIDNFPPKISQPTTPIQPKPLKGDQDDDEDDDFPTKSVRRSIESQKQATPVKKPLKGDQDDEDDDFPTKRIESQKQATPLKKPLLKGAGLDEDRQKETTPPKPTFQPKPLNGTNGEDFPAITFNRTKFIKDESPPKVAPLGDQKSLEGQEKMKALAGLKDFVEGEKSGQVKAKGIVFDGRNRTSATEKERRRVGKDDEQKEQSDKQTSITKGVGDLKEEKQLLINAGVAMLVILAIGAHIYHTVATSRKSD